METQTLDGWLTTEQACRILKISYSKFRRNTMPSLVSVQPSGKWGPRFFKEEDIQNLKIINGGIDLTKAAATLEEVIQTIRGTEIWNPAKRAPYCSAGAEDRWRKNLRSSGHKSRNPD